VRILCLMGSSEGGVCFAYRKPLFRSYCKYTMPGIDAVERVSHFHCSRERERGV